MKASTFNTFAVPVMPTSPSCVYRAGDVAMRVVVRNNSTTDFAIAFTSSDAAQGLTGSAAFPFPVGGESEVIIMEPWQTLYASAIAAGAQISLAISEAFPVILPTPPS